MSRSISNNSFYRSKNWLRTRDYIANSRFYICEMCGKSTGKHGYIVHHKIALTEENVNDPKIAFGEDNLQFLCIECHNKLHAEINAENKQKFIFDKDGNIVGTKTNNDNV